MSKIVSYVDTTVLSDFSNPGSQISIILYSISLILKGSKYTK